MGEVFRPSEAHRNITFRGVAAVLAVAALLSVGSLQAQMSRVEFGTDSLSAAVGGAVTVPIQVTSDAPVTGFSFGVAHTEGLTLESVERSAAFDAILGAGGPDEDFYALDTEVSGGNGFIAAVILPPGNNAPVLPIGTTRILDARYRVAADAVVEPSFEITGRLSAEAGAPRVQLVVDVMGGEDSRSFAGSTLGVTFVEGFVRGDADFDGRLTITDTVRILAFLFQGDQRSVDCLAALNYDGSSGRGLPTAEDTADIQLDDAVRVVNFLFRRSMQPPAAPYPDCGQSETPIDGSILCTMSNCRA